MEETGHNQVFDGQGNCIEDDAFSITDDQLQLRELDQAANDYHPLARQAFNNWGSLTLAQKDTVLKFLLGYYLSSARRLHYYDL